MKSALNRGTEKFEEWRRVRSGTKEGYPDEPMEPGRKLVAENCVGRVLEIGCGSGRILEYLQVKGHDCCGVDIQPSAETLCRQKGLNVIQGDVDEFDTNFELGRFLRQPTDTVLFAKSFMYIERQEELLDFLDARYYIFFQNSPLYYRAQWRRFQEWGQALFTGDVSGFDFAPNKGAPLTPEWLDWFRERGYRADLFGGRPFRTWRRPSSKIEVFLSRTLAIRFERRS